MNNKYFLLLLLLICSGIKADGQQHDMAAYRIILQDSGTHRSRFPVFNFKTEVDLIDLGNGLLNRFPDRNTDTSVRIHNRRLHSSLLPGVGYAIQTGGEAELSYLGGFYTSTSQVENQSSLLATVIYTQKNQLLIPSVASLWTHNNKYNIQTDYRYLIYPLETFGLGGYSSAAKKYILDYSNLRLYTYLYKVIMPDMYIGLGYDFDYLWNVHEINPPQGITDFVKYNLINNQKANTAFASAPTLSFLYDTRHNSISPSAGEFVNVIYRLNRTEIGSSQNWQSLVIDIRKYFLLSHTSRHILGFWTYEWLTLDGVPPYILLPNIGGDPYANTGRGFAEARFRGRNMLYLESEYRFDILKNGLLGGVAFANTESFSEQSNDQYARLYAGYGAGIRIKFNKFSKTNVVFDYAFGTDGSRGVFLNLGEVF